MKGRNAQVSRIYKILTILEGAPHGLTVSDLSERLYSRGFEVQKRTVYRDLDALRSAGFPLHEKGKDDDNGTRWTLEKTTKVSHYLVLSARELVALYLARGMLTPLKETPFFEDLSTTFDKIEEKLSGKGRDYLEEVSSDFHFEPGPKWGLGLNSEVVETVRAACTEKHKLNINYSSTNSKTTRDRVVGPHFLYFAKGSLYLVAQDMEDSKNKIFSLPRVNKAEMLDEPFEGEIIDPERFFDNAFGVFQATDIHEIKLEFHPPVATFIRERKWHRTQRVVSKPNDVIELSMEVGITPELVQWVLGYGPSVKVISPAVLEEKILEQANKVMTLYRNQKGA